MKALLSTVNSTVADNLSLMAVARSACLEFFVCRQLALVQITPTFNAGLIRLYSKSVQRILASIICAYKNQETTRY